MLMNLLVLFAVIAAYCQVTTAVYTTFTVSNQNTYLTVSNQNITYNGNTYNVLTFTAAPLTPTSVAWTSGTCAISVNQATTVNYIIVGGGGGGGYGTFGYGTGGASGGGGAGGNVNIASFTLEPATSYSVQVGSGGTGGAVFSVPTYRPGAASSVTGGTVSVTAAGGAMGGNAFAVYPGAGGVGGNGGSGGYGVNAGDGMNATACALSPATVPYSATPVYLAGGGGGGAGGNTAYGAGNGYGGNGGANQHGGEGGIPGVTATQATSYGGGGGGAGEYYVASGSAVTGGQPGYPGVVILYYQI
jgi:hypothetical protein